MTWDIDFFPEVIDKDLRPLSKVDRKMIMDAIEDKLGRDPVAFGEPLRGDLKGCWRLRVGMYRVAYRIIHDEVLVLVIKVGKRRDDIIYKELAHRYRLLKRFSP